MTLDEREENTMQGRLEKRQMLGLNTRRRNENSYNHCVIGANTLIHVYIVHGYLEQNSISLLLQQLSYRSLLITLLGRCLESTVYACSIMTLRFLPFPTQLYLEPNCAPSLYS